MTILRLLATLTFGITVSTTMTFTAGPPTQSNSTLVANPNAVVANGTASMPLTFTAFDYYGNLAPGVAVTLSASGSNNTFGATFGTTNASGVFATTLTSTYAQSEVITASFGTSSSVTTIVQFLPGAASSATSSLVLSPNAQVANNSNTILASLTLCDASGNPIPNVTPTFTASGTSTTVSAPSATSATGLSSVTYQTTLAQNENALVNAGGLSFIAPMVFVAGPPAAAASTLAASPNIAAGNGSAAISLVTTVRDAQGNAVLGASVALSASGGNNTFTAANGNTAASGTYSTTLKSTSMQMETITALIAGSIYETVSVTFTGDANATTSSLAVSPNTQTVGPSNLITATLTLRDGASNALSGVTPTWSGSGSSNIIISSGATSASGLGTATYSSTLAQNENVNASAGGLSFYQPVKFVAGSPNATTSYIYAIPTRQVANNSNTVQASVMLFDAYNNPVSGQMATFSASGNSTTVSGPVASNSSGLAQALYATGTIQNQNALVSAGSLILSTPIIFTDIPTRCTLAVNPNSQNADGNSSFGLTAMVANSNSQPIPNVQVIFSSSGSAQVFSAQNVITSASGQATSSLSSLYAGSDTILAQAANVQCVGQGNFLTRSAYCSSNPNFSTETYATSNGPYSLATGDFNGDNKLDIAVGNYSSSTLGVFLNTGSGTFQPQVTYATGIGPQHVAVGDLNNDGRQDIIVANYAGTAGVFLGTGDGNFRTQVTYTTGSGSYSIAVGDFNGDGQQDVAVANFSSATFSVLLGTGTGVLQTASTYATGSRPNTVNVGDFNADGKQDIVVANDASASVGIFLGTGTGTFQSQVAYATINVPYRVTVADFNGDGKQDLALASTGGNFSIMMGTGSGSFQPQVVYATGVNPWGLAVGDLNGDGMQDVIVVNSGSNTFGLYQGTGTGTVQAQITYATGKKPQGVTTGDFNGDGKQDVAVVNNTSNTLGVYLTVCP